MRFVLINGESNYNALRNHIVELGSALEELGHEVFTLDFVTGGTKEVMREAIKAQIHGFVAFNAMACDAVVGDEPLFDALDTPYITCLVDHPAYHWESLDQRLKKYTVMALDHSHVRFLERFFDHDHFSAVGYLPTGATTTLSDTDFGESWLEERDISIFFSGSMRPTAQRAWREFGENTLTSLLDDAVDLALSEETLCFDDALDAALKEFSFALAPKHRKWLAMNTIVAHNYIETFRRQALMKTLSEAEVPVTIVGKGWEPVMNEYRSFKWLGEGNVTETASLMKRSRIVLNSNNNFTEGAHERVFAAQASGAAVLSDASTAYEAEYKDEKEILYYRWQRLNELPSKIEGILNAPEKLSQIAAGGWRIMRERHSWKARARKIVEISQIIAAVD